MDATFTLYSSWIYWQTRLSYTNFKATIFICGRHADYIIYSFINLSKDSSEPCFPFLSYFQLFFPKESVDRKHNQLGKKCSFRCFGWILNDMLLWYILSQGEGTKALSVSHNSSADEGQRPSPLPPSPSPGYLNNQQPKISKLICCLCSGSEPKLHTR